MALKYGQQFFYSFKPADNPQVNFRNALAIISGLVSSAPPDKSTNKDMYVGGLPGESDEYVRTMRTLEDAENRIYESVRSKLINNNGVINEDIVKDLNEIKRLQSIKLEYKDNLNRIQKNEEEYYKNFEQAVSNNALDKQIVNFDALGNIYVDVNDIGIRNIDFFNLRKNAVAYEPNGIKIKAYEPIITYKSIDLNKEILSNKPYLGTIGGSGVSFFDEKFDRRVTSTEDIALMMEEYSQSNADNTNNFVNNYLRGVSNEIKYNLFHKAYPEVINEMDISYNLYSDVIKNFNIGIDFKGFTKEQLAELKKVYDEKTKEFRKKNDIKESEFNEMFAQSIDNLTAAIYRKIYMDYVVSSSEELKKLKESGSEDEIKEKSTLIAGTIKSLRDAANEKINYLINKKMFDIVSDIASSMKEITSRKNIDLRRLSSTSGDITSSTSLYQYSHSNFGRVINKGNLSINLPVYGANKTLHSTKSNIETVPIDRIETNITLSGSDIKALVDGYNLLLPANTTVTGINGVSLLPKITYRGNEEIGLIKGFEDDIVRVAYNNIINSKKFSIYIKEKNQLADVTKGVSKDKTGSGDVVPLLSTSEDKVMDEQNVRVLLEIDNKNISFTDYLKKLKYEGNVYEAENRFIEFIKNLHDYANIPYSDKIIVNEATVKNLPKITFETYDYATFLIKANSERDANKMKNDISASIITHNVDAKIISDKIEELEKELNETIKKTDKISIQSKILELKTQLNQLMKQTSKNIEVINTDDGSTYVKFNGYIDRKYTYNAVVAVDKQHSGAEAHKKNITTMMNLQK